MSDLVDYYYLDGLKDIIINGVEKTDRTNTGTLSRFGTLRRYSLRDNRLPVISTKKIFLNSVVHELLWMISGSTNISYLKEHGVSIWDSWVKSGTEVYNDEGKLIAGELGKGTYGEVWRSLEDIRPIDRKDLEEYKDKGFSILAPPCAGRIIVSRKIDQLQQVIQTLRNNPDSRRMIVQAYDTRYADFAALPPCHSMFQFYSRPLEGEEKRELDLLLYLRSNDGPAGEPFNITSYALLNIMIAHITGHTPGDLVYVNGDHHIYVDQLDLVREQLEREPLLNEVKVSLSETHKEIDDFTFEGIHIEGYENFHPSIKYPVAV